MEENQQLSPTGKPTTGQEDRPRVLLGVTGSVAAIKCPEIASRIVQETNADVRILMTQAGQHFWLKAEEYNPTFWNIFQTLLDTNSTPITIDNQRYEGRIFIHYAQDEWDGWNRLGDPVLHIDLRDWAQIFVIAPLSAHTLAKISNGYCDDTLSCVMRAWDFGHSTRRGKPVLLAPAMNTAMWHHPLTQQQLTTIQGFWNDNNNNNNDKKNKINNNNANDTETTKNNNENNGVQIIAPQVKTLACGEVGDGALAGVEMITSSVINTIRNK